MQGAEYVRCEVMNWWEKCLYEVTRIYSLIGLGIGMANTFQELRAWQKARELTCLIYKLTNRGAISHDFGYKDQLQRAAVSVMTNIAEGFGYARMNQFKHYLTISRASGIEVQSLLYVGLDAEYFDDKTFQELYTLSDEVISITSALKRSLK